MSQLHNNNIVDNVDNDSIDFKKTINKLTEKWFWFLISCFFLVSVVFVVLKFVPPTYKISARLLVNDDSKGGGGLGKQASALMDLGGLMGSKNSVDNEAEILKTRFLMEQVVREMQLNITYYTQSTFGAKELYESPFKVNIINGLDTIKTTKLEVKIIDDSKISITEKGVQKTVGWGQLFNAKDVGTLQFVKNPNQLIKPNTYLVKVNSIDERVAELMKQLSISVANKQVSIIDLDFTYTIPKRGEDILNALIDKYTESNLKDKNSIADSTGKFIKQRLSVIAEELGDVENEVESFKEKNKLADMTEQGKALVQSTTDFASDLAKAETQVSILNDLEKYMKDDVKNKRVFPTSLLPQDMIFSELLAQYNALLIERDKQLLGVTEQSPFIRNIDNQISGLRKGILANIQNTKNTFVVTRDKLRTQLNQAENQISSVPQIEKNYLKLARNREIKQELYIFLMQKAEETAISKTSNISIAKVIDPPKSEFKPIAPKKGTYYVVSFIAGLLIPMLIILASDFLNTTISTKEDIIALTRVPILGEISHNISDDNMIVANQGRSAISEQFRALRTNLSFYLKTENEKVILLTSSMSGEGKSFTAINLANILALSGKKVLLMELDLRKPGLSTKLGIQNNIGFSNFTISPGIKIDDIIKPLPINKNMFLISSGPIPPNPAETLMSEHTLGLLNELKKRFDYIIMDAPPIGIITDAQLLAVFADVSLYLVRQKVTKKDQLAIVDELYRTSKMKNLGIVVNDIVSKLYGYGYGYGNYGEEKNVSFWTKLIGIFKNR